jgi:metallo-beta-lactamase family protein
MPAPLPMTAPLSLAPDVLLVESTYGNRRHPADDTAARLGEVIRQTTRRGGKVLMPTFAVGRAQALMLMLHRLRADGELPDDLPVYLDSPMAQEATAIYNAHRHLLRLSNAEARGFSEGVKPVHKPQDSARLMRLRGPAVILASSGMATGGRVLGHLAVLAPDPRNAIVFPGFQVPGSRGGRLVSGATEVKVMGQYVAVKAQVHHLEGLSGHADADGLIAWMRQMPTAPKQVMVVHGEPEASDALRIRIEDTLGWPARVPQAGECLRLGGPAAALRDANRR